jgi:hypothetical protein
LGSHVTLDFDGSVIVEVIGHQQAFGGVRRGNPLNHSDLRDAARHVAGALLVKRSKVAIGRP